MSAVYTVFISYSSVFNTRVFTDTKSANKYLYDQFIQYCNTLDGWIFESIQEELNQTVDVISRKTISYEDIQTVILEQVNDPTLKYGIKKCMPCEYTHDEKYEKDEKEDTWIVFMDKSIFDEEEEDMSDLDSNDEEDDEESEDEESEESEYTSDEEEDEEEEEEEEEEEDEEEEEEEEEKEKEKESE
jgi:flagellar biosynthesis GTPase FlhF